MNPKINPHTAQNMMWVTKGHSGAVWLTIALSTIARVRLAIWNNEIDDTIRMPNSHLSVRFWRESAAQNSEARATLNELRYLARRRCTTFSRPPDSLAPAAGAGSGSGWTGGTSVVVIRLHLRRV
jgi:hypothetical protein